MNDETTFFSINVDYFREIEILPVLEHFGIEFDNRGKFKCLNPEHDDTHPSAEITKDKKTWICWVCQKENGKRFVCDAIETVKLIKNLDFKSACLYLYNNGFVNKEAIKFSTEEDREKYSLNLELPKISKQLLNELNLKNDPRYLRLIHDTKNVDKKNLEEFPMTTFNVAELMISKLEERKHFLYSYAYKLLETFKDLSTDTQNYIKDIITFDISELKELKNSYIDYIDNGLKNFDKILNAENSEYSEEEKTDIFNYFLEYLNSVKKEKIDNLEHKIPLRKNKSNLKLKMTFTDYIEKEELKLSEKNKSSNFSFLKTKPSPPKMSHKVKNFITQELTENYDFQHKFYSKNIDTCSETIENILDILTKKLHKYNEFIAITYSWFPDFDANDKHLIFTQTAKEYSEISYLKKQYIKYLVDLSDYKSFLNNKRNTKDIYEMEKE